MFKLAFKQYKKNWKISIGVFVVLLVSSMLIASTSFLFMAALGYTKNHPNADVMNGQGVNFQIIGLMFAVAVFLSIIVIFSTLNLMVKLKADQYAELRILGFTFHKITSMIYAEVVILLIIPLIVSLIVAKPLGNWYAQLLIENGGIGDKNFNVNDDSGLGYLYILFTIILVFIVVAIAIAPIKKISMTGSTDVFKKKTVSIVFEWIFGIIFIAGGIGVALADKQMNIATALFPDIFFVIGIALISKYIFNGVLWVVKSIFAKASYFNNSLQETRKNSNQNSLLITMIAMMIMFVMFSTDIIKMQVGGDKPDSGMSAYGKAVFNSISTLLTIVVVAFSIAVALNTLMIYFVQKAEDYDNLRINGYTRWDVIKQTIYQALILAIAGLILGLIPAIGLNLGFSSSNGQGLIAVKNIGSFIGMVIGIPGGFVLIGTTITGIQMLTKKIR